jgi:hypothetical protein
MLIELWERLRGYDKWIPTEARIESSEKIRKALGKRFPNLRSSRVDFLAWQDLRGKTRYGAFATHDTSPLYQLLEGESVSIRYDPTRPDSFYCRALWISRAAHLAKASLLGVAGGGFIVWRIWMIIKRHGF